MLFEDYGRRLILRLNSSEALPSELVAFVFNVVDVASAECPLTQDINIPLVQNWTKTKQRCLWKLCQMCKAEIS